MSSNTIDEVALESFFKYKFEGQYLNEFKTFVHAYTKGREEALAEASRYVNCWQMNMDSIHESTVKGIISEIAQGVSDL